jgi:hypothetical protein
VSTLVQPINPATDQSAPDEMLEGTPFHDLDSEERVRAMEQFLSSPGPTPTPNQETAPSTADAADDEENKASYQTKHVSANLELLTVLSPHGKHKDVSLCFLFCRSVCLFANSG